MALTINSVKILNEYVNGVLSRADHHAENVNEIVLALVGAVIWRATEDVKVRTRLGSIANMMWITIGENQYVLNYNHEKQNIELKRGSAKGVVITTFDDNTTLKEVRQIFSNL